MSSAAYAAIRNAGSFKVAAALNAITAPSLSAFSSGSASLNASPPVIA